MTLFLYIKAVVIGFGGEILIVLVLLATAIVFYIAGAFMLDLWLIVWDMLKKVWGALDRSYQARNLRRLHQGAEGIRREVAERKQRELDKDLRPIAIEALREAKEQGKTIEVM